MSQPFLKLIEAYGESEHVNVVSVYFRRNACITEKYDACN